MTSICTRLSTTAALAIVLSLAGPSQAHAERAAALSSITIDNFGQVNDGYYRGAQPKGDDYKALAGIGIRTVIDLSDEQANEAASVQAAGMRFVRIALTTRAAPAEAAVTQFLALVADPANQPVYVHCQGGRHRTGIMTAVYRMSHDHWTPDQAFAEMVQYEFKKGLVSHDALKRFVFAFTPGAFATALAPAASEPERRR